jgi:hypothetical protein
MSINVVGLDPAVRNNYWTWVRTGGYVRTERQHYLTGVCVEYVGDRAISVGRSRSRLDRENRVAVIELA